MSGDAPQLLSHSPRTHEVLLLTGLLIAGALLTGCQKSLFPESAPRTQFERYDTLRAGAAPKDEPDVFGTSQPALRARLTPKTQQ